MKKEEMLKAIELRKQGLSMNEIKDKLQVSKSSVSYWVRNIELTSSQRKELTHRGFSKDAIEKRRITRLTRENARRQVFINQGKSEIKNISLSDLFLIGISLYWGEGGKTNRGSLQFTNSDPRLIKIMMRFFIEVCGIPKEKFRGHVHLHPHLNIKDAESYWSNISEIPLQQIYKTSQSHSKASKNKRGTLPFGTFDIYVHSTERFLKMMGWMEGLYEKIIGVKQV